MPEPIAAAGQADATFGIVIALFQRLELGVVILPERKPEVRLVNLSGANVLARFGWRIGQPLPEPVHAAIAGAIPMGRAVPITAPDDSAYHLRVRVIPPMRLVTIQRHRTSTTERQSLLKETFGLTPQEVRLVELVRAGLSNAEIGRKMKLRATTVKQYLNQIYAAVGVHSRVKLVAVIEQMTCGTRRSIA
jgi:DNA-binding CsgD family transcriptional regulator